MVIPFVNDKKYEVTFGKEKDSFVASVGAPASINIETQTAVVNKPTKIDFSVLDAKGINVKDVLDKSKFSVSVNTKTGYYNDATKELTLWKVGDTAEVTVTYHTWTYDQKTGKENVIVGKATVNCVEKSAITVTGIDKYTIAPKLLSWDTDNMNTTIPMNSNNLRLFVRMKKSDGKYVSNADKKEAGNFTLESINPHIAFMNGTNKIYGNNQGSTYIKVTYYDGQVKYEYTIPVTVGAAAKATTVVINKEAVTLPFGGKLPTIVTAKILDQYGNTMTTNNGGFTLSLINDSMPEVAKFEQPTADSKTGIYRIALTPNLQGTSTYKFSNGVIANTFRVTTANFGDEANGLAMDLSSNESDLEMDSATVLKDLAKSSQIKINIVQSLNGMDFANIEAGKLKDVEVLVNGNKETIGDKTLIQGTNGSYTFNPLVDLTNKQYILLAKNGTYPITISGKYNDKNFSLTKVITVKNVNVKPVKGETYDIKEQIPAGSYTAGKFANAAIVSKLTPNSTLSSDLQTSYARVLDKGGNIVYGQRTLNSEDSNSSTPFNVEGGKIYNLDQAAVPAKAVNDNVIFVVDQFMNDKVKGDSKFQLTASETNKTAVYKEDTTLTFKVTATSNISTMPTPAIYSSTDSGHTTDLTTSKFSGAKVSDNTLTIPTQNADAGSYVAVVSAKNSVTGKTETATVNFTVEKANWAITNVFTGGSATHDVTLAQNTDSIPVALNSTGSTNKLGVALDTALTLKKNGQTDCVLAISGTADAAKFTVTPKTNPNSQIQDNGWTIDPTTFTLTLKGDKNHNATTFTITASIKDNTNITLTASNPVVAQ